MINATLIFPDHEEERTLEAMPAIGSPIAGPSEAGETWRVAAVDCNGTSASITCEAVPAPATIHGDNSPIALGWICEE